MYWPNIAVKYAFWLWCYAAPTAGCVLACVVSDCTITENSSYQRTQCVPRVLACWYSDRPTWDMKNILYIWFSHFTLTEKDRCQNFSLSLNYNKKDSPCWQLTQGSRYGSHARSLETSWWIGKVGVWRCGYRACEWHKPQNIFRGGCSMKTPQIPMLLHIVARVCGQHWHT